MTFIYLSGKSLSAQYWAKYRVKVSLNGFPLLDVRGPNNIMPWSIILAQCKVEHYFVNGTRKLEIFYYSIRMCVRF